METYAPSTRATRDTSIEAFWSLNAGAQQEKVMQCISKFGPISDREVGYKLIIANSTVSARRGHLVEQGRVRKSGTKKDPMTGKRVTLWEEVPSEPYQRMLIRGC